MSWTKIRSQIAIQSRHHPDLDTSELRRDLRAARAEEYIREVVAAAPPLTAEQRDRLAVLLRGTPADAGSAA